MEPHYSLTTLEEQFLRNDEALGRSPATRNRYVATFTLFHRFLCSADLPTPSAALTTETLRQFALWLRQTPIRAQRGTTVRAESGVHAHLRDLRALSRWLLQDDLLVTPVKIPLPKIPQRLIPILSEDELRLLWTSKHLVGRSSFATRNRAMIGLMLDTGLRREEVATLRFEDIDFENCLLIVIGKGDKQRRVPFSSRVQQLLLECLRVRRSALGPFFHISAAGIRSTFRRIADDISLERFHPHQLRHQAATMLVRNPADLESVRRILGHADLSTTAQYTSLFDADLRAKHAAASPFDAMMRIL